MALVSAVAGCTGPKAVAVAPTSARANGGAFHVVAEGPCSRLSLQTIGDRTFVVYGDTGYDLHDWEVGEKLAAAQSIVEIRQGEAYRPTAMFGGLPLNSGGYVPADLRLGGTMEQSPWLVLVDTKYAPRGAGALFERESRGFVFEGSWRPHRGESPVDLPAEAAGLPALPDLCEGKPGVRFVKLAATTHPKGDVFVAGRCTQEGPIASRGAPIQVAHGAPGARAWTISRTPESHVLDGIVNVAMWTRRGDDAYLVAYEPFKSPDVRQPYLARWNGKGWAQIETGLPEGLMSVSGTEDGTLWIAAGRAVYRRPAGAAAFAKVEMPALRFASDPRPATLRLHTVRAVSADDVWVEGTYRVKVKKGEVETELRSGVLFRSRPGATHACDAREPAEKAFARVE